jgi:hypothetical protein
VNALAIQSIQICRQRGDESLALAGFHFRDSAFVQNRAADELHIKVPHIQNSLAGLPYHGKCFGKHFIQGFAVGDLLLEFRCLA